jgi:HAD superfamily hydrolase (TIGR01490 family)
VANEDRDVQGRDDQGRDDQAPVAPGASERADVVAAAAAVAAERGDEAGRTEERYARPDADRLSDATLADIAARRTGAVEAAFFDLDKTIIARSSTLVMGRTFFKDGLISSSTVLRGLYAQAVYQLVGADHTKMEQMRRAALDLTQGWEADRVRALVRETVEEVIAPLVYAEALALIEEHRGAGRDVWIVSSSGEEIVEPFAGYLGVDEVLATRSGIDDEGRYDGTLEFYAYGGAKATAIRQVAAARGYDLRRSYAYSDSITDLPMLSAVGHPTAVNPDRELRAAAVAMGWEARDFTAPVRLRDRLPAVERKRDKLLVGTLLAAAVGAIAWRVLGEDDASGDERL